jgi:hypothetical protein
VSDCPGDFAAKRKVRRYDAPITLTMEQIMRKPRDFDSELKALTDKANMLKERKVRQFGELVIATGADGLNPETLTGALLAIAKTKDAKEREAWRVSGAAFFQGQPRKTDRGTAADAASGQADHGHDAPR